MSEIDQRVVLAAGGTGGHVFPAEALARELLALGYKVFIFSDGRGQQFKNSSSCVMRIPACHFQGSIGQKIRAGMKLIGGISVAVYHLWRLKPNAVIGFGGYASFPTLVAASVLRLPIILHQADAYLGRANRLLAPLALHIATSFPHVENIPRACLDKVSFTGLPIRSDIMPELYAISEGNAPFHLLITGGSQGAKIFGEIVPQAVSLLDPLLQERLHISQQCRAESLNITQALYKKTKAKVELSPFLDRMGERYKQAHLIISRAGASSVLETALVGRPALFVPYPYAMDDHQAYNAQQVVNAEGGWMIREKEFTFNNLASILTDLITSPWKLKQAAANIQTIAAPDAAMKLAHLIKLIVA